VAKSFLNENSERGVSISSGIKGKKHTREIAVQSKRISHHDTKHGAKRAVKKVISVLEIAN